jgi:hypothetical protein
MNENPGSTSHIPPSDRGLKQVPVNKKLSIDEALTLFEFKKRLSTKITAHFRGYVRADILNILGNCYVEYLQERMKEENGK